MEIALDILLVPLGVVFYASGLLLLAGPLLVGEQQEKITEASRSNGSFFAQLASYVVAAICAVFIEARTFFMAGSSY